jgi:hypothetical protein
VATASLENKLRTAAEVAEQVLALATTAGETGPELAPLANVASEIDPLIREARAGRIPARALEIASNRAKVVLMSADAWIAAALLRHAALGAASPYDGAMLRFLAKARGLAKPSKAIDEQQRAAEGARALERANLPTPKLIEVLLDEVRDTHTTREPDGEA